MHLESRLGVGLHNPNAACRRFRSSRQPHPFLTRPPAPPPDSTVRIRTHKMLAPTPDCRTRAPPAVCAKSFMVFNWTYSAAMRPMMGYMRMSGYSSPRVMPHSRQGTTVRRVQERTLRTRMRGGQAGAGAGRRADGLADRPVSRVPAGGGSIPRLRCRFR